MCVPILETYRYYKRVRFLYKFCFCLILQWGWGADRHFFSYREYLLTPCTQKAALTTNMLVYHCVQYYIFQNNYYCGNNGMESLLKHYIGLAIGLALETVATVLNSSVDVMKKTNKTET